MKPMLELYKGTYIFDHIYILLKEGFLMDNKTQNTPTDKQKTDLTKTDYLTEQETNTSGGSAERLRRQMAFCLEIDKEKFIGRPGIWPS